MEFTQNEKDAIQMLVRGARGELPWDDVRLAIATISYSDPKTHEFVSSIDEIGVREQLEAAVDHDEVINDARLLRNMIDDNDSNNLIDMMAIRLYGRLRSEMVLLIISLYDASIAMEMETEYAKLFAESAALYISAKGKNHV